MFEIRLLTNPATAATNAQVPRALKKCEIDRRDFKALNGDDPLGSNLAMELGVACTVMPPDFLKELRNFSSYQVFKDRVLEYTDRLPGTAAQRGKGNPGDSGTAPMQLGSVDPWDKGQDPWGLGAVGKGGYQGTGGQGQPEGGKVARS